MMDAIFLATPWTHRTLSNVETRALKLKPQWWVIDSNDAALVRMFHHSLIRSNNRPCVSWVTDDQQCLLLVTLLCNSFWPSASIVPWNVQQPRRGSVNWPFGTRPNSTRQKPGTNSNIGEITHLIQVSQLVLNLHFISSPSRRMSKKGPLNLYW